MRANLRKVDRCPGKLDPGEYKRVPIKGELFGIFLACPACGYRCITVLGESCATGNGEPVVTEVDGVVSVRGRVKCLLCAKPAVITDGIFDDA